MRNLFVASLAAGLLLAVGNAALAQSPEPSANVNVGGQNFDLSSAITDTGHGLFAAIHQFGPCRRLHRYVRI